MFNNSKSIRPFIGAKDFNISRSFYRDCGFHESVLTHNLSYFDSEGLGFYLQDYYAKDWIDNTMVFLEVDDVERVWKQLQALDLPSKYPEVRVVPIRLNDWGRECFVHDPSGILWHLGQFK